MYADGASNTKGSGIGVVLTTPSGMVFDFSGHLEPKCTNNEAEYEALIKGMEIARLTGVKNLQVHVDSAIIAGQVSGIMNVKEERLHKYLKNALILKKNFATFEIVKIPREHNQTADALAKSGSDPENPQALKVALSNSEEAIVMAEEEVNDKSIGTWMEPIILFLKDETLPEDKVEARKILIQASRHCLVGGVL